MRHLRGQANCARNETDVHPQDVEKNVEVDLVELIGRRMHRVVRVVRTFDREHRRDAFRQ